MAPRAHVYLEDAPLGAYVAQVRVNEIDSLARETLAQFEVDLDDLYSMRLHIDNAIRSLEDRKLTDAICGVCEVCRNTRMANEETHHRGPVLIHCPVCHPKIEAVRETFKRGLVMPHG
jgi:hypothetical protein